MTAPDQVLAEVLAYPENKHVKHAGVFHVMQVVSKASDTDHTIYNYNDYGQVTSKTVGPGNRGGGSGCQRGGGQCSCSQCIGGRCETCVVNGYTGEAIRFRPKQNQYRYGHEEKAAALPEPDHTIYNYNGYGDVTSKTVGPGNRGGGASCQRGGGQCSCSQCIGGRCETCVVNGNTGEAYRFRPKENQYRYGHDGALDLSSMTAPDQVLAEVLAYPENKHVKHAGVFHVMQVVSKASDTDHTIYNYNDYGQVTSKTVGPGNRGGGSGCQRGGGQCSCSQCIGGRCETCVVNGYTGE